ncbi:hypothetical protein E2562_028117 [Oryza meyeriana var. granulata]|uniref:Uncharacterized protein n=1 Tax=Oryza meyeriana var. granulata TaxID=110450 RepID=A0A6G1C9H7_9ORYZ|nr:hypothetical protein E2562_028117 [Oryza meyeriana var. granulata]
MAVDVFSSWGLANGQCTPPLLHSDTTAWPFLRLGHLAERARLMSRWVTSRRGCAVADGPRKTKTA